MLHVFAEVRKIVLGNRKIDVYRILQLDVYQGRTSSSDVVSGINESSTGTSVIRRANVAILKVQLREIDGSLIFSDGSFKVLNLGAIDVYLLVGNEALLSDLLIALKISLKQSQLRLVGLQLTLRLLQVGLEGAWIDDKEQITLFHFLSFDEVDFRNSSIHLRLHVHRFGRGESPKFVQLNRHIQRLHMSSPGRSSQAADALVVCFSPQPAIASERKKIRG